MDVAFWVMASLFVPYTNCAFELALRDSGHKKSEVDSTVGQLLSFNCQDVSPQCLTS